MKDTSLLTVLIVTYNHKNYLSRCIESILEQKANFGFQIYVLDDCSFDGTSDIVREYAAKYPDIVTPFIRDKNSGGVDNVYDGIKSVKTKYFLEIEGDDYLCDENKFQIQIDALELNPEYSFCGHNTLGKFYDNKSGITKERPLFDEKIPTREFNFPKKSKVKELIKIHTSSRIYRTSCIDFENLKNKEIICWDSTLYWYFLSKGKLFYIDKIMSVYNSGQGNFSGAPPKKQVKLATKNIIAINRHFNFNFNKMYINMLEPYLLNYKIMSKFQIFMLKHLIPKIMMDKIYNNIEDKFLRVCKCEK